MTLTLEDDVDSVNVTSMPNGQRSLRSKHIVWTHKHRIDCLTWTQKWSVKARCHYAIWFEAGRRQVQSSSRTTFEPVCDQLRSSFGPVCDQIA